MIISRQSSVTVRSGLIRGARWRKCYSGDSPDVTGLGEKRLERPFAPLFEPERMRRVHLRGHDNILKWLLVHVGGFNLGLLMRQLTGIGTPPRRPRQPDTGAGPRAAAPPDSRSTGPDAPGG